jgi:anion-transporting  ArsA/GET3 family ATPase
MKLLDHRILLVTGKGGTGKTTVAAALGLWAARSGRRTLICETKGAEAIGPLFHRPSVGYSPTALHPNLFVMSITSKAAIEDYVVQQIKVRQLYRLVFRNRVMAPFIDAVPGLHDAVHLGKVFDLIGEQNKNGASKWDLVIVDAPATGHGLHMIRAPRAMMELTRTGPIFEGVRIVDEVMSDPNTTGILATCLPEEMPINETISLWKDLGQFQSLFKACVLNEMDIAPFTHPEDWEMCKEGLLQHTNPAVVEAGSLCDAWMGRLSRQEAAKLSLDEALPCPITELPLFPQRVLGFSELQVLSEQLEHELGAP